MNKLIYNWQFDETLLKDHELQQNKLNERSDYITEGIILRSKTTWIEQGEKLKSNKYFLTLEKRRKCKTHLRKIVEGDNEVTNPKEILKSLQKFYKNLYSQKNILSEEECLDFISKI